MSEPRRVRPIISYIIATVVILCALGQVYSWQPLGIGAVVRSLLSLLGISGAVLLICRQRSAWFLLLPWTLLQTWVLIRDPSGPWFLQSMMLGGQVTISITRNGQLTSYQGYGVNFAGLIWTAVILLMLVFRVHAPYKPSPKWLRLTPQRFIIIATPVLLVTAWFTWSWWQISRAPLIINSNYPGTLVYYHNQLLGRTPLGVTPEKIKAWKLPLNPKLPLKWTFTDYTNRILICTTDLKSEVVLDFKAPFYAPKAMAMPTPWGLRNPSTFAQGSMPSNEFDAYLWNEPADDLPGMSIELLKAPPYTPGEIVPVKCVVWNPQKQATGESSYVLLLLFGFDRKWVTEKHSYSAHNPNRIDMPPDWNDWPSGTRREHIVKMTLPHKPGYYTLRASYGLEKVKNRTENFSVIPSSQYMMIQVVKPGKTNP